MNFNTLNKMTKRQDPSQIKIRAFRPVEEDYEAIIRIWDAAWPNLAGYQDRVQVEDQKRDPALPLTRLIAEAGSESVGYGDIRKLPSEEDEVVYYISIQVLPGWRRRGIGSALYDQLFELLKDSGARTLFSDTYDTFTESVRFLEKRGFVAFMRYPLSILDIARFDFGRFQGLERRLEQEGIRILPLSRLQKQHPDWKEKLWRLDSQIQLDAPAPVAPKPLSFEAFCKKKIASDWFEPDLWMIALDGQQWVGESALEPVSPGRYWTHITGVLRDYRRKGIATALKVGIIKQVSMAGGRTIQTSNEEHNPMYQINLLLGFQAEPTEVHYRKDLV